MRALTSVPRTVFPAPSASTAPAPAEARGLARDEVRLLVARPGNIEHTQFRQLPDQLTAGDLLVINTSATVPGEIDAYAADGRPIVLHLATRLDDGSLVVELRTAPDAARAVLDAAPGQELTIGGVRLRLIEPYPRAGSTPTGEGNRLWRARADGDLAGELDRRGRPIAYGYLDRRYPLSAYQSVFASVPGSAEMPSAGRPFSESLITRLVAAGIRFAPITLHTGVSSQEAGEAPQPEWYDVPATTSDQINHTRETGGRVIAVGTTATRAVESAVGPDGTVRSFRGWTDRVISPDAPARVVTGLITGWHDPHASHLLLVESIAGPELTQAAYDAAVEQHYLWHEFGDSALLLPEMASTS
ncbi:S-adenosylmethionine:tRNA ribosyltransferase-isomerase [Microlunatus elymi]|uniref:S-adenosylmethionine:tRNA ribosyltransferase-isomerase n=1 Tax=Microlunatus elymi TaxID=2596828 RepID=A0A516Q058_9ACTN|nr:S-adenosylmethionine:tRNA ribosyltransferase-isomerase [Microlunatus elymi]QDP96825.1 S-adenosylmethionine:tRNA ribosyltransferase-isomerase [Microlunatus elymi]